MAKKLEVAVIDERPVWDDFAALSPQGTAFSQSAWVAAAAYAQGGELTMIGVYDAGKLVAGLAYVHIERGPVKKATSPAMTPYCGIHYRPDPGKRSSEAQSFNLDCASAVIQWLEKRYQHVFLVHSPAMADIRPFSWAGYSDTVRYTFVMDITDVDSLWDMLERRVRTVIRNAEDSLTLGDAVDVDTFGILYEHIYGDRGQALPFPTAMVKTMTERILKDGLAEMRSVKNASGETVSAMILVRDSNTVYAWLSGSLPGENSSGAFSLLFWDGVKRYSETHSRLDMVGANIKSIAFFKKGFAGELTPYYVSERYSSLFARLSLGAYSRFRKVFR